MTADPWVSLATFDPKAPAEDDRDFCLRIWLAHGQFRTIGKVAASTGVAAHRVANWAREEDWEAKGRAYDAAQGKRASAEDPKDDHALMLSRLRTLCQSEVAKLLRMSLDDPAPAVSVSALSRLVEKTVTLERLIRDQATVIAGGDWDQELDDTDDEALARLAARLPRASE